MPIYTSDQNVKSGVPLGGLGAGKMEILPSGVLDHFTFLNNIHAPLSSEDPKHPKGVLGFHFGVFVKDRDKKTAKLLQTVPVGDHPLIEKIKYNGAFPFAHLAYEDKDLPVGVELEAWAPFIRGDEKHSSLPAAYFTFKISNPWTRPIEVALFAAARNIIGEWGVGRFNQCGDTPKALHLSFFNKKAQAHDPSRGEMCLSLVKHEGVICSHLSEWNMQAKPFVFDRASTTLGPAWEAFSQEGVLPNINTERLVTGESHQLGGALAAKLRLKPKSHTSVTFVLSWSFPGAGEGHFHESWLRQSLDVAQYAVEKRMALHAATKDWVKELQGLPLEPWFKDALLNNLYPLVSSTLWTRRGRFAVFEAPRTCPLSGTLDVRFYGSLPLALLFPRLELKEMIEFAEVQRPQGYIPHDLGLKRADLPSDSTNGLFWKDLNAKFILLVYRDYLYTKDEAFLKKMYPFVKKAFYWLAATDKNKDFLPDDEGADQTFDLWPLYGAGAYVSGIFLASLLALEKMAQHAQDESLLKEAHLWSKNGRRSFEKKLWHKNYFIAYNNSKGVLSQQQLAQNVKAQKINISCMASQLTGQWAAHLLGLGYIASPDKIKKAVGTMLELNAAASPFGAVNGVLPSGERDKSNLQSENVWFGTTYALAGLALLEGFEKEGWALARKAWENAATNTLDPWDQPDLCSAVDGAAIFGDHYMRNMVLWSLLLVAARKDKAIQGFLKI